MNNAVSQSYEYLAFFAHQLLVWQLVFHHYKCRKCRDEDDSLIEEDEVQDPYTHGIIDLRKQGQVDADYVELSV
eukprot:4148540-Amphidinium_carterae.2